jgi:hypothetical protein
MSAPLPSTAATTRHRHAASLGTALLAAAAVLVGCGGSSRSGDAEATGSATSSPPPATATLTPADGAPTTPGGATATEPDAGNTGSAPSSSARQRCTTGNLSASLGDPGEGAGQRYATLVLTNRSGAGCLVEGYGGIGLVDGAGRALPTQQVRDPAASPEAVVLEPGASATSRLQWSVVPGGDDATDGPCRPTPAALQVIPPDEQTALSVDWPYGAVCSGGRIEQQAYRAGS